MGEKLYQIAGCDVRLKDLTLNELKRVNEFLNKFSQSGKTVSANLTGLEAAEFLALICEPASGSVDFGDCKETVSVEIIRDFFLSRMQIMTDTRESLNELTRRTS